MDARFAGEQAIGVLSVELNRGVLDAGFLSRRFVEDGGANAVALRPAQVHAQQNGGPVLGFRAAGAGLDGHDGAEVIVFAGKQRARFEFPDVMFSASEFAVELLPAIVAPPRLGLFLRQRDIGLNVACQRTQLFVRGNLVLGAFPLAQHSLRGFLVIPEIWFGDAGFERFQALAVLRGVKNSSAQASCVAANLHSDAANPRESCSTGLRRSRFRRRAAEPRPPESEADRAEDFLSRK